MVQTIFWLYPLLRAQKMYNMRFDPVQKVMSAVITACTIISQKLVVHNPSIHTIEGVTLLYTFDKTFIYTLSKTGTVIA